MTEMETLLRRIRRHAQRLGYRNTRALLAAAGVSESTFSRWKTKRASPNMRTLARIFGAPTESDSRKARDRKRRRAS